MFKTTKTTIKTTGFTKETEKAFEKASEAFEEAGKMFNMAFEASSEVSESNQVSLNDITATINSDKSVEITGEFTKLTVNGKEVKL
jgi:hypothetical protein